MKIDGYTRMAAVIAHPIRHSISPFIHNLAYELTATNAAYLAWDIAEEDLESTISQIRKLDMIGANISMPYKQKVFPYLDEVDEMANARTVQSQWENTGPGTVETPVSGYSTAIHPMPRLRFNMTTSFVVSCGRSRSNGNAYAANTGSPLRSRAISYTEIIQAR